MGSDTDTNIGIGGRGGGSGTSLVRMNSAGTGADISPGLVGKFNVCPPCLSTCIKELK
jgi:hypothetical protein